MTGIRYLTDEKGRKVAVQIDLKKTSRTVGRPPGCTCLAVATAWKADPAR